MDLLPPVRTCRVVVLGAGIAGLAAATALRREQPGLEVVVVEAAGRVGGKLALAEVGGVTTDVGAEAVLARRPEGLALIEAAGLGGDLEHAATTSASVWSRGALRRLPRSVLGVPADTGELAASGVLSPAGLTRALAEPELPVEPLEGDEPVGALVERRFGAEVVDRLLEPLLGGVYAGHARELSARATAPQVVRLLDGGRSMTAAAAEAVAGGPQGPVFAGVRGGVGRLPVALAHGLDVRTCTTARTVRRTAAGWRVETTTGVLDADAVVVALPAPAAARVLADAVPAAAAELAGIAHASMAVVTHAVAADALPPTSGSGLLVPPVERRHVKAATYSFAKWDWVRSAGQDAGVVLLRTSAGRHREAADLQVDDAELVRRSLADLRDLVGITARPVDSHVMRWGGGLPQYAVGHLDRVRRVREALARAPGLSACGAAYDGLGIPACAASAKRAARTVLDHLDRPGRMEP